MCTPVRSHTHFVLVALLTACGSAFDNAPALSDDQEPSMTASNPQQNGFLDTTTASAVNSLQDILPDGYQTADTAIVVQPNSQLRIKDPVQIPTTKILGVNFLTDALFWQQQWCVEGPEDLFIDEVTLQSQGSHAALANVSVYDVIRRGNGVQTNNGRTIVQTNGWTIARNACVNVVYAATPTQIGVQDTSGASVSLGLYVNPAQFIGNPLQGRVFPAVEVVTRGRDSGVRSGTALYEATVVPVPMVMRRDQLIIVNSAGGNNGGPLFDGSPTVLWNFMLTLLGGGTVSKIPLRVVTSAMNLRLQNLRVFRNNQLMQNARVIDNQGRDLTAATLNVPQNVDTPLYAVFDQPHEWQQISALRIEGTPFGMQPGDVLQTSFRAIQTPINLTGLLVNQTVNGVPGPNIQIVENGMPKLYPVGLAWLDDNRLIAPSNQWIGDALVSLPTTPRVFWR